MNTQTDNNLKTYIATVTGDVDQVATQLEQKILPHHGTLVQVLNYTKQIVFTYEGEEVDRLVDLNAGIADIRSNATL